MADFISYNMFLKLFSDHSKQTDETLLNLYKDSGNVEWLGKLYSRYLDLVYGVSLKYLKNREEAQDAVIQIFEKLVEVAVHTEVKKFRPWIYVVARNYCLMELRKNKHQAFSFDDEHTKYTLIVESDYEMHPIDEDENESIEEALKSCIKKLKLEQKQSIELFYYQQKSYQEIAQQLNLDIKKVKSYIQNGKRNIKMCLERNEA